MRAAWSTILATMLALDMQQVTGPDGQLIEVNPSRIVSLRAPRSTDHFAPGTKCLIFTSDGKYLSVTETCPVILEKILPK